MKARNRNVIWAVDPFASHVESQTSAAWAIDQSGIPAVMPVYVWNELPIGAVNRFADVRSVAEKVLKKWAKPRLKAELRTLHVLRSGGSQSAERAEAVVAFAKRKHASLIVASHHTWKGFKRWWLGSFCESLSLISDIPLLIVPPRAKPPKAGQPILFPVDFSDASNFAFEKVLDFAVERKLPLTLYHKVEYPIYPPSEFVYSVASEIIKTEREIAQAMRESAEKLGERARARGVETRVVVDARRGIAPVIAIVEQAKQGYSFVAMAAHSGFFERFFLGSTTRFLIRKCPAPIWIMHLPAPRKRMRKS